MSAKTSLKLLFLLALETVCSFAEQNTSGVLSLPGISERSSRVLSRRKRFLVFPDGSSFQYVFCTQTHGYLQIGDIVWFGNTAALAWELPSDPKTFYFLKEHEKIHGAQNRNGVSKHVYYLDEDGRVLSKVPYKKRLIVNPAMAKRSIDFQQNTEENGINKISIKDMHETQRKLNHYEDLDTDSIEFHREGRISLYPKIEKLIDGLGWRGKECVLRLLCETAGRTGEQGTFLEEIMRATFTLPQGEEFEDNEHKEYDKAHKATNNCTELYPDCKQSLRS